MTFSTSASSPPNNPPAIPYPGLAPALGVAGGQGGVITYRQAMASGLTRGQLRQLVHTGQWSHPVRGAFVVSGGSGQAGSAGHPDGHACGLIWAHGKSRAGSGEPRDESSPSVLMEPVPADLEHHRRSRSGGFFPSGAAPVGCPAPPGGDGPPGFCGSMLCARARAALIGRPHAVVCGITAARLQGFPTVPAEGAQEPVHLLMPARLTRAQPRGIRLHFSDLDEGERVEVCGIPVTAPARTLADLVLTARTREAAVAYMDAALRRGVVPDLEQARAAAARRRGFRSTSRWWSQADGRAESELETRLRLLLVENGLAPPELQWPVTDGTGQLVARLDLAWPDHRVDVEADVGPAGDSPHAVYLDRHRGNVLAALRWAVLRFTTTDVTWHPERVTSAVSRLLTMRGAEMSDGLRAS